MKVLFISTKGPLPTNDGHCLRTYNLLRQIAKYHDIYLLSFVKYQEEYTYVGELQKLCKKVEYFSIKENDSPVRNVLSLVSNVFSDKPFVVQKYDTLEMRTSIMRLLSQEDIDLVHLDMLPLYCYRDLFVGTPVLLNQHNIESALLLQRVEAETNPIRKLFFATQQKRLEMFEKAALSGVDHVAVCSEQDMQLAKQSAPGVSVTVIPNGVDLDFFKPSGGFKEEPNSLVFVGGLNWYPNLEGMEWFDREILPEIIALCPNVKIHLIGRSEKINWINPHYFVEHGFVDDIRPYLEKTAVFIVPLRVGGGTRLKILDAMGMEKAIVSTTIGAEGLGAEHGQELLLADTASSFAKSVVILLENRVQRHEISQHARAFVSSSYGWDAIGEKLLQHYDDLLGEG